MAQNPGPRVKENEGRRAGRRGVARRGRRDGVLARARRLLTRVLRFCEKHNFTKSRKRDSAPRDECACLPSVAAALESRESFARSPGRRSVTRAEVTSGGGLKASRGISKTNSGRV